MFVNNQISVTSQTFEEPTKTETTGVKVQTQNGPLNIFSLNMSPSRNQTIFSSKFEQLLTEVWNKTHESL